MSLSIYRGSVLTASDEHSEHRVKVLVPGIWEDKSQIPYIESVNGIYLRKKEDVYLLINDTYDSGIVIGRMRDWLNAQEITDLFNMLIDAINADRESLRKLMDAFNGHGHTGVYSGAAQTATARSSAPLFGQQPLTPKTDVERDLKQIKVDNVIHKD